MPTRNDDFDRPLPPAPELDNGEPLKARYAQVTLEPKHWYKSKTIWFNAAVMVVGLVTAVTPALEQYMSAETYSVLASGVAFVNAVLRLVTDQPIKNSRNS